jgi:hypothetical protein
MSKKEDEKNLKSDSNEVKKDKKDNEIMVF